MSVSRGSVTRTGTPNPYIPVVETTVTCAGALRTLAPPPLLKVKRCRTLRSRPSSSSQASNGTRVTVKPSAAAASSARTSGEATRAASAMSVTPW